MCTTKLSRCIWTCISWTWMDIGKKWRLKSWLFEFLNIFPKFNFKWILWTNCLVFHIKKIIPIFDLKWNENKTEYNFRQYLHLSSSYFPSKWIKCLPTLDCKSGLENLHTLNFCLKKILCEHCDIYYLLANMRYDMQIIRCHFPYEIRTKLSRWI